MRFILRAFGYPEVFRLCPGHILGPYSQLGQSQKPHAFFSGQPGKGQMFFQAARKILLPSLVEDLAPRGSRKPKMRANSGLSERPLGEQKRLELGWD